MEKHTHKLIVHIGINNELHYTAPSYRHALALYDIVRARLTTQPWGYTVSMIESAKPN